MTWLVIAHAWDDAARWAADRLPTVGLDPVCYLTDVDLARATWAVYFGANGTEWELALPDGRVISDKEFDGALNRLIQAPPEAAMGLQEDDRPYGHQEFSALLLAWLNGLPGPVVNTPTPRGLCGDWRSPAEWALLAAVSGLNVAPVRMRGYPNGRWSPGPFQHWPPFEPIEPDAIVLGDAFFARDLMPEATVTASLELAARSDTRLIGLKFDCPVCSDSPNLVAVTPFPNFELGGDQFLVALRDLLTGEPSE